tara:strand:+ start:259 stop:1134 length:876 start_codon:yes stop_codon:yes gene_type:complete
MSVRSWSYLDPKQATGPGSLFGAAIGTPEGGFWNRLAVSPPRTPPSTTGQYTPLPPEFHLDAPPAAAQTRDKIDSVFPSWVHDFSNDAVLVTFVQSADVVTLRASPRLECTNVVHPTMVRADAVSWRPMACDATGVRGHLFLLSHEGRLTGRIEVTLEANDEIGKLLVVQPEFSPLTVAARVVSPSSLLVFDDVRAHTDSLEALRQTLTADGDVGYVPTQELVVTRALDQLVLATDHSAEAAVARRHWKTTKLLLAGLSTATANCIDAYTQSEFRRVGKSVFGSDKWRHMV